MPTKARGLRRIRSALRLRSALRVAPLGGERPPAIGPAGEGDGAAPATRTRTPHPDLLIHTAAPRGEGKRLRRFSRRNQPERTHLPALALPASRGEGIRGHSCGDGGGASPPAGALVTVSRYGSSGFPSPPPAMTRMRTLPPSTDMLARS